MQFLTNVTENLRNVAKIHEPFKKIRKIQNNVFKIYKIREVYAQNNRKSSLQISLNLFQL